MNPREWHPALNREKERRSGDSPAGPRLPGSGTQHDAAIYVPFGPYDASNPDHDALVSLVERAEEIAAQVAPSESTEATRAAVRKALADADLIEQLEETAARVLPIVDDHADQPLDVTATKADVAAGVTSDSAPSAPTSTRPMWDPTASAAPSPRPT